VVGEDSRYYTLARGGFIERAEYALSWVLITRTNDGNETQNISEIAGTAAGITSTRYPVPIPHIDEDRTELATRVGLDSTAFASQFWPGIN
jgi:hypothetical protein